MEISSLGNDQFKIVTGPVSIPFMTFSVKDCAYTAIRTIIGNGYWASLIYSIAFVALHAAMGLWLWRKRIFVKI